jgi:hypothetical protein
MIRFAVENMVNVQYWGIGASVLMIPITMVFSTPIFFNITMANHFIFQHFCFSFYMNY